MTDEFRDEPTEGEHTHPGHDRPAVVVVGVDFSATARHALAWALDYASHRAAVVHTVHVVDRRWSPADLRADAGVIQREVAATEAGARAELESLTADARARVGALHEHVVVGKPADELLRVAREVGADLLVVGNHGLDPIAHLLVGSVAEQLVRRATCSVMVVRTPR